MSNNSPQSPKFFLFPVLAGNFLEILEFSLYGIFSKVFADIFFGPGKHTLIYSLLIFSTGFLARPIGGIIFGYVGDAYGRKTALIASMVLMSCATLGIGLLPESETMLYALLTLRVLQGISCGGEYIGSVVYLCEKLNPSTGRASSYAAMSGMSGGLTAILISYFAQAEVYLPNWRAPFIITGVLGFFIVYMRGKFQESPMFVEGARNKIKESFPLLTLLKTYPRSLLVTFMIGGYNGILSFTMMGYINVFLMQHRFYSLKESLELNAVSVIFFLVFGLLLGRWFDKFKLSSNLVVTAISLTLLLGAYWFFSNLTYGNTISLYGVLAAFGALAGMFSVMCNVMMYRLFPTNIRYSGLAFGYSLGIALLGGNTPVIYESLLTWKVLQSPLFLFLSIASLLPLLGIYLARKINYAKA